MTDNGRNLTQLQQMLMDKLSTGEVHKEKIGIYIFGTGEGGKAVLEALETNYNEYSPYQIKGFLDNNHAKHGQKMHDVIVMAPDASNIVDEDFILLASLNYYREMQGQLLEMGINKTQIISPVGWLDHLLSGNQEEWLLPEDQKETNKRLLRKVIGRVCGSESPNAREYILQSLNRKSLLIPLDFEHTVKHAEENYVYSEVKTLIDNNMDTIRDFYEKIKPYFLSEKLLKVTDEKQNEFDPYWNNGFFSYGDARALYGIVSAFQPRVAVEVGAGNSTKFMRKAINDYGLKTQIISIDPEPRADIKAVSDVIIPQNILNVDYNMITNLQENDIFYIDGSHLAHCGTDVVHHFLNILPKIPRGVIVHFHDICLPYEYMPEFRVRHYNEQHMLATMLLYSNQWEVVLPIYYLYMQKEIEYGGASFWIRKI